MAQKKIRVWVVYEKEARPILSFRRREQAIEWLTKSGFKEYEDDFETLFRKKVNSAGMMSEIVAGLASVQLIN